MSNRTEIKDSNIEVTDSQNVNFGSVGASAEEKVEAKPDFNRSLLQAWQDAPWYTKLGVFCGVLVICLTIIVWKVA